MVNNEVYLCYIGWKGQGRSSCENSLKIEHKIHKSESLSHSYNFNQTYIKYIKSQIYWGEKNLKLCDRIFFNTIEGNKLQIVQF